MRFVTTLLLVSCVLFVFSGIALCDGTNNGSDTSKLPWRNGVENKEGSIEKGLADGLQQVISGQQEILRELQSGKQDKKVDKPEAPESLKDKVDAKKEEIRKNI